MTRFAAIDEKKRAREGDKAPPIAKGFFFRPSAKELRPLWQASPPSALTLPARSELELPLFLSQRCRSNLSSVPGAWKGQEIEARCRVAARFASSLSNSAPAFRSLSRSCRRLFPMSSTTEAADQFFYFSLSLFSPELAYARALGQGEVRVAPQAWGVELVGRNLGERLPPALPAKWLASHFAVE